MHDLVQMISLGTLTWLAHNYTLPVSWPNKHIDNMVKHATEHSLNARNAEYFSLPATQTVKSGNYLPGLIIAAFPLGGPCAAENLTKPEKTRTSAPDPLSKTTSEL